MGGFGDSQGHKGPDRNARPSGVVGGGGAQELHVLESGGSSRWIFGKIGQSAMAGKGLGSLRNSFSLAGGFILIHCYHVSVLIHVGV